MRHAFYPAVVDRDGDGFLIRLPDFDRDVPFCARIPGTEDPYLAAVEAAAARAEALRATGDTLPTPSPLEEFCKPRRGHAPPAFVFNVPVPLYRDYVRVNINVDPHLLRRIDQEVAKRGMTRSSFLAQSAAEQLEAA